MKIPALTVRLPWFWAIFMGYKFVENRGWRTPHRGPFALHNGLSYDTEGEEVLRAILASEYEVDLPDRSVQEQDCPRGHVVATVNLAGICGQSSKVDKLTCQCGPWGFARQQHWWMDTIRPLLKPFPALGKQGLWEVDLPDSLIGAAA